MAEDPTTNAPTEIRIGGHIFRWEPPDLGYVAYVGDMDGPTMAEYGRESRRFTLGKSRVFLIVDLARAGHVNAEARKISADGAKGLNLCGIAVAGASPTLRIFAGLATRAIDILHRNTDNPTRFFETEAEARAWIAERRRVLGAR